MVLVNPPAQAANHWQIQEVKQRLSEVLRHVKSDGPQFVTRHGEEEVAIIDINEYRRLTGQSVDLMEYLAAGPKVDELDAAIQRPSEPSREIDLEI